MRSRPPSDKRTALLKELAARARRGDRAAFEQLLRRLRPGLTRVLLRRTGGQTEVTEDLVQSTWIAVWEALRQQRYDPEKAAISTFVYAVAQKLWLQHLRRSGRAGRSYGVLDGLVATPANGPDNPTAVLQAAELLDAMRACLHAERTRFSLTADERGIVIGLAHDESERTLADQLGVAASTIHARKRLAYEKLRRCLTAKGFWPEGVERGPIKGEQVNGEGPETMP